MIISQEELKSFILAKHSHPHERLGMHPVTDGGRIVGVVVRAFLHDARQCYVLDVECNKKFPMLQLDAAGFFELFFERERFKYQLIKLSHCGEAIKVDDPYAFLPTVSQFDCYLFGQGRHRKIFNKLGAHPMTIADVVGVAFAVWAPNAMRVSVVGDFNRWDGRYHPMRLLGASGIWELFIPGIKPHDKYKYEILCADHRLFVKSDPYGNYFEPSPHNASIVYDLSGYVWHDDEWIRKRTTNDYHVMPLSIYEVHLDSWMRVVEDGKRPLTYRELGDKLANYVKSMGFTHVELMPILEHPFSGSWGYQVTGFYAITHRYGTPKDFMHLVDTLHCHGIGVIIDWVPAHFPCDAFALAEFDGSRLYEHEDRRRRMHEEWGTLIFNYGRHEVRNFLLGSILNLCEHFHVDGFRVDAVASMLYLDYARRHGDWIPNRYGGKENIEAIEFLREMNSVIHEEHPGVMTIAEESTTFGGVTCPVNRHGLGFDFKWNMGWMHDTLHYFSKDPVHRKYFHNRLTFAMLYQYSECFISALSHDEVVYGKRSMLNKMPGDDIATKARHLMTLYSYMWFWPGKKSLFMGSEFGQSDEWQYFQSLDWHLLQYDDHKRIQKLVSDLNGLYRAYPVLFEYDLDRRGFEWVSCDDCDNSVIAFIRKGGGDDKMLIVCNFTPVARENYRVGISDAGEWKEIFNSDSVTYGGENRGNFGYRSSDDIPFHGRPYSLNIYLPPLSVLCFLFDVRARVSVD